MFEHSRHFPRGRRHAGNCHDRMTIDFQNFVSTIVNHGVSSSRATVAGYQNAAGKLESENRRGFCRHKRMTAGSARDFRHIVGAALCGAVALENLRLHPKSSDRAPEVACPLLASALAIALGLVGIDLAHFFEQILGVRPRNIRRSRTTFVPLLWTPRSRIKRLLHALRHTKNLRRKRVKASQPGSHIGVACQSGPLMPKFESHEIARCRSRESGDFCSRCGLSRNFGQTMARNSESGGEPGSATARADEKDRGAKRQDRHALAGNSQA